MRPSKMFQALVAAGLCGMLAAPAFADEQSDRLQALEKRLEGSVQLIEKLTARIAQLERSAKEAPPAPSTPVAAPPRDAQAQTIAALQDSVNQLSEGLSRRGGDAGLPVHGFADVRVAGSSGNDPIKLRGANGGTLDLYLTPQFGDRTKGLMEIAFEYSEEGQLGVDMERLQLGYTVNDALTVWAGRFHTPFGLWNTSFHHGANLQTSIYRPRFVDFEDSGGIIPAHSVGIWGSGKTAFGNGHMTYDAYIANGPRIVGSILDFNAYTDNSANKMLGGNLGWQPGGTLAGLTLGVHAFGSTVTAYADNSSVINNSRLRMAGGYLGYDENDWEIIGEYYHFANANLGDGSRHASNAAFLQVGRDVGGWTPFVRVERAALDPADDYFRSQEAGRSYRRAAIGARYALTPKASFKLEFSNTSESAVDQIDENGASAPFAARSYRRSTVQYSVAF